MNANSKLHVLVAEDDPVNSTILKKRLEKFGYQIRLTGNGKECAAVYRENPSSYDAILMDLQV
jgi:CheY-like chemotaxis protein